jgi:heme/copper-type cytochrome/quinol oxidase subunit 3
VSVIGPMFEIQVVTLVTAFGIAVVKAYLVAKNFMHVTIEKRYIVYMVTTCLIFMLLFFAGSTTRRGRGVVAVRGARTRLPAPASPARPERRARHGHLRDDRGHGLRRLHQRLRDREGRRSGGLATAGPAAAADRAFNTVALLASGVALFLAQRSFSDPVRSRRWLLAALGLGGFFVLFQGFEWVQLIGQGLTLTSSTHGSFFYLIVGAHALHAVAALLALLWVFVRMTRSQLVRPQFQAVQVFWYFVVGIWPVLYLQVYL